LPTTPRQLTEQRRQHPAAGSTAQSIERQGVVCETSPCRVGIARRRVASIRIIGSGRSTTAPGRRRQRIIPATSIFVPRAVFPGPCAASPQGARASPAFNSNRCVSPAQTATRGTQTSCQPLGRIAAPVSGLNSSAKSHNKTAAPGKQARAEPDSVSFPRAINRRRKIDCGALPPCRRRRDQAPPATMRSRNSPKELRSPNICRDATYKLKPEKYQNNRSGPGAAPLHVASRDSKRATGHGAQQTSIHLAPPGG